MRLRFAEMDVINKLVVRKCGIFCAAESGVLYDAVLYRFPPEGMKVSYVDSTAGNVLGKMPPPNQKFIRVTHDSSSMFCATSVRPH